MDKITILNIDVLNITRQQLLENLHGGVLITPNLDHLIKLQKVKESYDFFKKADWIICDSNILRLFSKVLKIFLLSRWQKELKLLIADCERL